MKPATLEERVSPLDMSPEEFREVGHAMVERIASLWENVRSRPVTFGDDPDRVWELVGRGPLPPEGAPAGQVLGEAFDALSAGSLLIGHPKFFGYITAPATPIGVLSEMVAAGINPNCGGWPLSPVASAMEMQSIQWISELIGYRSSCGGLLCSGGNVANMIGFWSARRAKLGGGVRKGGIFDVKARIYAPKTTHTWLEKIADLSGFGTDSIVWVPTNKDETMQVGELAGLIERDVAQERLPFFVVASGGTVGTGAVDDIRAISAICQRYDSWLHIDGAYGAPAACLPDAPAGLHALALADSIALDPHKWLYAPLEAGCALVRDRRCLSDAFGYRPPYYEFHLKDSDDWCNFYELGIQNSRGFRALKVWSALRQAGRAGVVETISQDVHLAQAMADRVGETPCMELHSRQLSIVCFRYVPAEVDLDSETGKAYVNRLNKEILFDVQEGGEGFVSNVIVDGAYYLRACIVNFRTRLQDVYDVVELCRRTGERFDATLGGPGAA